MFDKGWKLAPDPEGKKCQFCYCSFLSVSVKKMS